MNYILVAHINGELTLVGTYFAFEDAYEDMELGVLTALKSEGMSLLSLDEATGFGDKWYIDEEGAWVNSYYEENIFKWAIFNIGC